VGTYSDGNLLVVYEIRRQVWASEGRKDAGEDRKRPLLRRHRFVRDTHLSDSSITDNLERRSGRR
jgi:hypothetical protein